MIVIGASLGGMKAVRTILRSLPATFSETIVVALHRHREGDDILAHLIQKDSPLPVSEVVDKEPIERGRVYLAPADYHLLVERGNFTLSTDDPVQFARPSIDVLFESAADAFGAAVIGVVLTGANQDGARGAARIQERGGLVIVQDPKTAESGVMPKAALEATRTPHVYPLDQMGAFLLKSLTLAAAPILP
jgi:two-component system chemotaxis response regulator CheB